MVSRKHLPGLVSKFITDKNGVMRRVYVVPDQVEGNKQVPVKLPEKESYDLTYQLKSTGKPVRASIRPQQGNVLFYTTQDNGNEIYMGQSNYKTDSSYVSLNIEQRKDLFQSRSQMFQAHHELTEIVKKFHQKYLERHGDELQKQKEETAYKEQQNRRQVQAFYKLQERQQQKQQAAKVKEEASVGKQLTHKQRNYLQDLAKHPIQQVSYYPNMFEVQAFKQETYKEARKLGIPSRNKTLNKVIDQVLDQAKKGKRPYTGD